MHMLKDHQLIDFLVDVNRVENTKANSTILTPIDRMRYLELAVVLSTLFTSSKKSLKGSRS
jgi:hypothetical protein